MTEYEMDNSLAIVFKGIVYVAVFGILLANLRWFFDQEYDVGDEKMTYR